MQARTGIQVGAVDPSRYCTGTISPGSAQKPLTIALNSAHSLVEEFFMRKPRLSVTRFLLLGVLATFSLASAHADTVTISISGNWGTVTTGPGLSTTPFNSPAFSFTTNVTDTTPIFSNAGETELGTTGGSYTDGSTTTPLGSPGQMQLTIPAQWNGQDFGFGVYNVYTAGDFLELDFNGPQLFSGPTNAPIFSTTSVTGQEAWYGFSARYYNGVGYSTVVLDGNAAIAETVTPTPEPASAALISLSLLPMIGLGLFFNRRRRA